MSAKKASLRKHQCRAENLAALRIAPPAPDPLLLALYVVAT
nr:hypothetical protein [Dyella sp. ASV24]